MDIYKERLPSLQQAVLVWAVCAFPVFSWAIYQFLEQMPGWLTYLAIWDVLSIFAYVQAFALVESLLIVLALVVLAAMLPGRLLRNHFVSLSTAILILTTLWVLAAQYNDGVLRVLPMRTLVLLLGAYVVSIIVAFVLVHRYPSLRKGAIALAERFSVLLYLYVPVGLIGLIVVILRNI